MRLVLLLLALAAAAAAAEEAPEAPAERPPEATADVPAEAVLAELPFLESEEPNRIYVDLAPEGSRRTSTWTRAAATPPPARVRSRTSAERLEEAR